MSLVEEWKTSRGGGEVVLLPPNPTKGFPNHLVMIKTRAGVVYLGRAGIEALRKMMVHPEFQNAAKNLSE